MDPELRARAETLLENAARMHALADPRGPYRDRLRALKDSHPDAFRRAVSHYESVVLPALASGTDPLATWLDYGRFLGGLTSAGGLVAVDATGRSTDFDPPVRPDQLVLFVPADAAAAVLPLLQPVALSDAQRATIDLLVNGKFSLDPHGA